MKRRTVVGLAGGALVPIAGCLGSAGGATPDPSDDDGLVRSGSGAYPHEIAVHNDRDRDVELTVTVERSGTLVYRETHTVAADTETVVAGITRETLPEGDRRLALTATTPGGQSSQVEVTVTGCLGSVVFYVDPSGELGSTYSIC